ncbi:flotillin family protein, partial [Streptomyces sp. NPDC059604]
ARSADRAARAAPARAVARGRPGAPHEIAPAARAGAGPTSARLKAEAEGARLKALAEAEGTQAQAVADAAMIGEKLKAEAAGLTEKAAAMAALDDASRGHEEYRLRLAAEKEIRLAGLDMQRQVAEAQATVLATGLENADIDIVGGESVFFDRLVSAVSMGKGLDGFVENSDTAKALAGPWLNGTSSFTEDLTRMVGSVSTGDVRNLTVSALLTRMMQAPGTGVAPGQVQQLLSAARELGLADVPVSAVTGALAAGDAPAVAEAAPVETPVPAGTSAPVGAAAHNGTPVAG